MLTAQLWFLLLCLLKVISTSHRLILIYTKWRPSTAGTNGMKKLHLLLKWNQTLRVNYSPNKFKKLFFSLLEIFAKAGEEDQQEGENDRGGERGGKGEGRWMGRGREPVRKWIWSLFDPFHLWCFKVNYNMEDIRCAAVLLRWISLSTRVRKLWTRWNHSHVDNRTNKREQIKSYFQAIWIGFFWDGPKLNKALTCACIPTHKSSTIRSFDPFFGNDNVIVSLLGLI